MANTKLEAFKGLEVQQRSSAAVRREREGGAGSLAGKSLSGGHAGGGGGPVGSKGLNCSSRLHRCVEKQQAVCIARKC